MQAIAFEKAASQLSTQYPLLSGFITEEYRDFLSAHTFLTPTPYSGDIQAFVKTLWKQLRREKHSAFVGRTVLVPGTNKRYMQPGHLFFNSKRKLLTIDWFECEKNGHNIPEHRQLEHKENVKLHPCFDDDHLTYSPFIFSKALWSQGVLRMLPSSSFTKLLKPPKLSPTTSPAPKTSVPPPNVHPRKSAKAVPPTELDSPTKHSIEFQDTVSPAKENKTVIAEPTDSVDVAKEIDSQLGNKAWKHYQCQYKAKGVRCTNEAMWCEKENSKVPKYCDVIKFHKLGTAHYSYWDLCGRGGFPDIIIPEGDTQEVDMELANDSESES